MPILTKSIYEPRVPEDGLRVLTTRYWPRGIRREKVDRYLPILGPSRELLQAYKASAIDWQEFKIRYLREIENQQASEEIGRLTALAGAATVTVMCVCKDDSECHRRLIKESIEANQQCGGARPRSGCS